MTYRYFYRILLTKMLWISGLSGGFICEFLQFCWCLFSCWWSEKDTDCTCCVDCILEWLHHSNHKNLSFPSIYDMFSFLFFEFLCLTTLPLTPLGVPLIRNSFLLGMEFTRAAQVVAGILFHSSIMTSRSCWMLDTWGFSTFHLRMPHMCSIGFRSGDILGHSITITFSSKAVVILALCLGWLLCQKTVSEGRASFSASECHSTCWNPCFLQ